MNFEELLRFAVDQNASDIHLQAVSPPQLRIGGLIRNVEGPLVESVGLRQFIASIAPPKIAEDLDSALFRGARFSHSFDGLARVRCALYGHRGHPGLILHIVPATVATQLC